MVNFFGKIARGVFLGTHRPPLAAALPRRGDVATSKADIIEQQVIAMKVDANTARPGHVLDHNGKLWVVQKIQIVSPGKGGAFIQVVMKDIRTGNKLEEKFRTSEVIERVKLDEHEMQFLFAEEDMFTFMNQENYEQLTIPRDTIGEPALFLQDGMICTVMTYEGSPLSVELPSTVTLTVAEADPVVKGQTASSSYKPAKLENGVRIMVPPHIGTGDRVVINTADSSYLERAK
jgi:elongation factor P